MTCQSIERRNKLTCRKLRNALPPDYLVDVRVGIYPPATGPASPYYRRVCQLQHNRLSSLTRKRVDSGKQASSSGRMVSERAFQADLFPEAQTVMVPEYICQIDQ